MPVTLIESLPYTISASGSYKLGANLTTTATSGAAITVSADDVTIDLDGRWLSNAGAGLSSTCVGILAANRQNVTVKNGGITKFYKGISATDSSSLKSDYGSHWLRDLMIRDCLYMGVELQGSGNRVENSQISGTQGYAGAANSLATGIDVQGPTTVLMRTLVRDTYGTGTGIATGISMPTHCEGGVIVDCAVSNQYVQANSRGIYVDGTGEYIVEDNVVALFSTGITFTAGASGSYRNNNVISCTTEILDDSATATDDGGNV